MCLEGVVNVGVVFVPRTHSEKLAALSFGLLGPRDS